MKSIVPMLLLCICGACSTTNQQIAAANQAVKNNLIRGIEPNAKMAYVVWYSRT